MALVSRSGPARGTRVHLESGLGSPLPDRVDDVDAWLARVSIAIDRQPLGLSAPCRNPECSSPVDILPSMSGGFPNFCRPACRDRARSMRRSAEQQLAVVDELLDVMKGRHGVPRRELRERARVLRWWLDRLPAAPS